MGKAVTDSLFEAIAYLTNRANNTTAVHKCAELAAKMPRCKDEIEKLFTPVIQFENLLDRRLVIDDKNLHLFFDHFDSVEGERSYQNTIASLIMYGHYETSNLDFESVFEGIRNTNQCDRLLAFALAFTPTGEINDAQDSFTIEDCLKVLKESGISAVTKWNVIEVILSFDRFVEDLYQLMLPVVQLIESKKSICENMIFRFESENTELVALQKDERLNYSDIEKITKIHSDLYGCDLDGYIDKNTQFKLRVCILGFDMFDICTYEIIAPKSTKLCILTIGVLRNKISAYSQTVLDIDTLAQPLKAIADPLRLKILFALRNRTAYSQELADMFTVPPTTLSHHLVKLVNAGFLNIDYRVGKIYYSTNLNKLDEFLANLRYEVLK